LPEVLILNTLKLLWSFEGAPCTWQLGT